MNTKNNILGIAIGGTKCAVTLGNLDGETLTVIKKTVTPTFPYDFNRTFNGILTAIDELNSPFYKIGVICGSPLNAKKGTINCPPNLPDFNNVCITEMLTNKYGVPATLINDADACAVAEWKFGAGKGYENMIFLTCGTGFGAGLILNGKLYTGALGMAGEIGHVRLTETGNAGYGKIGSCEGYLSGMGVSRTAVTVISAYLQSGKPTLLAKTLNDAYSVTPKEVYACAEKGDACALEIFEITAKMLGKTLAILVDLLNPDAIVLGGIYHRCEKYLKPTAIKVLQSEALTDNFNSVNILPSKLKEEIDEYSSLSACFI